MAEKPGSGIPATTLSIFHIAVMLLSGINTRNQLPATKHPGGKIVIFGIKY